MPEKIMQEKKEKLQNEMYVLKQQDYEEIEGFRKDVDSYYGISAQQNLQRKNNLSQVCEHIQKFMPETYTGYQEKLRNLKKEEEQREGEKKEGNVSDERAIELKCNRGTRLGKENDVLEFSLAGSGYDYFRREQKSFFGAGKDRAMKQLFEKQMKNEYNQQKNIQDLRNSYLFLHLKNLKVIRKRKN